MTDHELVEKLKRLRKEEKKITGEVLHLLREVFRRRTHLRMGYDSLFLFLVKELDYDEAAAARRSNAVQVMSEMPEIEKKLEEGSLQITNVAQAQSFFRRAGVRSVEQKREILKKLEGCSKRETERVLAIELPEAAKPDHARAINETQTEIRFVADQDLVVMLERVKELAAHRGLKDYNGLFKFLAQEALKKLEPKETKAPAQDNKVPAQEKAPALDTPQLPPGEAAPRGRSEQSQESKQSKPTRYTRVQIERAVWKRGQGSCGYISPITGKRCGSKHAIEYDHIVPWAMNGENTEENLQLLCRAHNRERAIEFYGEAKLQPAKRTTVPKEP